MPSESLNVTELVQRARTNRDAQDELYRIVERELKARANHQLRRDANASLFATELVNEAFPRLFNDERLDVDNRLMFFRLASRVMHQILIDHARKRLAEKRGGDRQAMALDQIEEPSDRAQLSPATIIAIHEALERLAAESEALAEVVEMHCFGGFTLAEIGDIQGIHKDSVKRRWRLAKTYLQDYLADDDHVD